MPNPISPIPGKENCLNGTQWTFRQLNRFVGAWCTQTGKNSSGYPVLFRQKFRKLALLPQGKVEAKHRALNMIAKMDELGFGNCSNTGACEIECPKGISLAHIARLNREFLTASFT